MQYKQHQSLANVLHTNPELHDFVIKLEQLNQIKQLVAAKLAPDLLAHCNVANLRDGKLILSTTSPTWNHKLRFCSYDLLSALRADPHWAGLKAIEIRVDYLPQSLNDTTPSPKKPKPMSKKSASALAEAAQGVKNAGLASAMTKLAGIKPLIADSS